MIKKFGVPEATNRVGGEILKAVVQGRILVVVIQAQVVSAVLTILCSTPEIRELARADEIAIVVVVVVAVARWENKVTRHWLNAAFRK